MGISLWVSENEKDPFELQLNIHNGIPRAERIWPRLIRITRRSGHELARPRLIVQLARVAGRSRHVLAGRRPRRHVTAVRDGAPSLRSVPPEQTRGGICRIPSKKSRGLAEVDLRPVLKTVVAEGEVLDGDGFEAGVEDGRALDARARRDGPENSVTRFQRFVN